MKPIAIWRKLLCDNLNCWNLTERRECDLRNGYKHHFCDKKCYAEWLSYKLQGDMNPSKKDCVRKKQSLSAMGNLFVLLLYALNAIAKLTKTANDGKQCYTEL